MERRVFQTRLGEVWLWGLLEAFDGPKPIIFAIMGAFSIGRPPCFFDMQPYFPDAAVLIAHLPGNHCPELSEVSIDAFGAAYSEAIRSAAKGRPIVVCGASTGALVALAMDAPEVRSMVLIEPPLRTGKLWPLVPSFRHHAYDPEAQGWARRFVENVFGYFPGRIEDRDYRALLRRLKIKAWFLLGDVHLMPERKFDELPSLVTEADRELIAAHPLARIAVSPGVGHDIPKHHDKLIDAALNKALSALSANYSHV